MSETAYCTLYCDPEAGKHSEFCRKKAAPAARIEQLEQALREAKNLIQSLRERIQHDYEIRFNRKPPAKFFCECDKFNATAEKLLEGK